jgi:peptide chain release factor 1
MLDKLQSIEKSYLDLQAQLYDPAIATDQKLAREINKKLLNLEEAFNLFQVYKKLDSQRKEAEEMMATETDEEMIALAKAELDEAMSKLPEIEAELKVALLPKDPNDDKDVFLEIRPAA